MASVVDENDPDEARPIFEEEAVATQRGITIKQWPSGFLELSQFDPDSGSTPYGSDQVIGIWPEHIPALVRQLQAAFDRAKSH